MDKDLLRGNPMICVKGQWFYTDTMEPTVENWRKTPCGVCKRMRNANGDDPCIEKLPGGVMNACCGHGVTEEAYIQFYGGNRVHGALAVKLQNVLLGYKLIFQCKK